MGVEKAFLNINGAAIIENTLNTYKRIFKEIIIVTNEPEDYEYLGVKLIKDIYPGKGPLGGLYSALVESSNERCFVIACDMPFINEDLIKYIVSIHSYDIVVPVVHGKYEALHAMYSRNCCSKIIEMLNNNNLKIIDLFHLVNLKEIREEDIRSFDKNLIALTNINTPEEYRGVLNKGKG